MTTQQLSSRFFSVVAVVIFLAAVASRFFGLERLSLSANELWPIFLASRESLQDMLLIMISHDNQPPGFPALIYLVKMQLGNADFYLRLPSAIAGILCVLFSYLFGRNLFSHTAGLLASVMMAGSFSAIFYSQDASSSVFVMLFAVTSAYHFFRLFVDASEKLRHLFGYCLSAVLLCYLHYIGMVLVACQAILVLCLLIGSSNRRGLLRSLAYSYGIVLLLYLRWLPVVQLQLEASQQLASHGPGLSQLLQTLSFLAGPDIPRLCIAAAALLLAVLALFKGEKRIGLLLAMILLPGVVAASPMLPGLLVFTPQIFSYSLPLLCLVMAAGIAPLLQKRLLLTVFLLVLAGLQTHGNLPLYTSTLGKADFRGVPRALASDRDFARHPGWVITSNALFNHYMEQVVMVRKQRRIAPPEDDIQPYIQELEFTGGVSLYFIELDQGRNPAHTEALDKAFLRDSVIRLEGITIYKYWLKENPNIEKLGPEPGNFSASVQTKEARTMVYVPWSRHHACSTHPGSHRFPPNPCEPGFFMG